MPLDDWLGKLFGIKTVENTYEFDDPWDTDNRKPDIRDYLSYDLAAEYDECMDYLMGFRNNRFNDWNTESVKYRLQEIYIIAQERGWRG